MGEYIKSEKYYQKSKDLYSGVPLDVDVANLENNLGVLYTNMQKFEKAEECYKKAIHYYKES